MDCRRRPISPIRTRYGTSRRRARQTGFNFTEVLFAVMILGIGFIMTAAIFPVALLQSKTSQEETSGAGIARGGANYLDQLANNVSMPATENLVVALDDPSTAPGKAFYGALLLPGDQRYAWKPFYRRGGDPTADASTWAPLAQVFMVPVAVRNRSIFDKGVPPVVQNNTGGAVLAATIEDDTVAPEAVDMIEFPEGIAGNDTNNNYTTVTEGSYVIVAAPGTSGGSAGFVGRIYRIGNAVTGNPRRWALMVPNDFYPERTYDSTGDGIISSADDLITGITNAPVFVVGRSLQDPSLPYDAADNPFEGGGQDVAAYTTFVAIR